MEPPRPHSPEHQPGLTDELVRRARGGSKEAQGRLVEVVLPALHRYVRGKVGAQLGRAVSISDVCQDSIVAVVKALEVLPEDATAEDFRRLLKQHARWTVGKAVRKHGDYQGESLAGPEGVGQVMSPDASQSIGEVTRQDRRAWLHEQIDRLSERDAEILHLKLRGDAFDAIAQRLGISEPTARQRYLRASGRLRALLDGVEDE